jgi:twitching motility protein PilT
MLDSDAQIFEMALVDSLLSAIVRADGDALVMHVGERPYVVVGTQTINISTHGLNLEAMTGMLTQLLPADAQTQLEEFGAVEYKIPHQSEDRFSVVAARGGDDIWIEIRRRRPQPVAAPPTVIAPVAQAAAGIAEPLSRPVAQAPPEPIAERVPAPIPEPVAAVAPEPVAEPIPEPEPIAEAPPEPVVEPIPEPMAEVAPLVEAVPVFAREMPVDQTIAEAAPDLYHAEEPVSASAIEYVDEKIAPSIEPVELVEPVEPVEPTVIEPAPIAAPVEQISYATAYDPILSEVEEPEAYVIDDTDGVAEAMEAMTGESAFVEAASARPIAEEPAPIVASIEPPRVEPPRVEPPRVEPPRVEAPTSAEAAVVKPPPKPSFADAPPSKFPTSAEATVGRPSEPSVVLPMTRTVRIEVPPRTVSSRAASGIDRLLRVAAARGATALFLTSDSRPWIRIEGDLRYLDSETPLSRADVESAILEIAPESGQESIGKGEPTEWIAEFENVGRIRCTTFMDHRGPGVLLRMIATKAATAEQLGLAREVQALATESQGLVLVAGPRASGKSTLLSALVDLVNRQRAEYVISLERQIRLVHDNKQALVSQREIRGGADDSVNAARLALRESPDVLVVDDLVSSHMVPLLLTAAAEGLLVFVSITAPSAAVAVERFVELAPPEMRKAVQSAMAESFRGAVAQVLLKKAGGGLVAAREVLLATAPVTRVIGEGQLAQLPLTLEGGRKHGMVSFNEAIVDFVRAGTVDVREAFRKAPDRDRLLESLKRNGIDTSAVERLA